MVMKAFLLFLLLILGLNFAYAEKKEDPKSHCYLFVSKCDRCYTKVFDHELSDAEYAYYQGFYDAQCDKNWHYC
ncbi:hypothetical protein PRMUPPPA20_02970 [Xylanibacter ruminicola]|uniref:Uncharacterized protein n=2 Tax=Xylanibacter ruminicola TaxID=839 RepID=A0AA37HZU7_XYLRU|nr:hypothetical protein PRMUPPPA20_02970 [Xylanibacter ruminicola]